MKKVLITVAISGMLLGSFGDVFANQISTIRNKKQSVDSKINQITNEKKEEQRKLDSVIDQKESIENEEKKRNSRLQQLQGKQIYQYEELQTASDMIKEAEKQYNETLELFKSRVRSMYMNNNYSFIDAVALSQDIVEFTNRYEFLNNIAERDKAIILQLISDKKDLDYKKKRKEEELKIIQSKLSDTAVELKDIKEVKQDINRKIKGINYKLYQLEAEEDELLKESERLARKIRDMKGSSSKYSGGSMRWPVPSSTNVTSTFGLRYHPVLKYNRAHNGIDVAAPRGVSIVAANDGLVRIAEWYGGYGNTVVIDHGGGVTTLYGHCSVLLVPEGAKVKAGDTIAKVGSTGLSTGPHLHFEVRKNGDPVDPMSYFR